MLKKIDWDNQIGRRLRLRDLHVLFTVAQRGSMAKAAAQLGVSTPTVSEVIADLEHGLGVRLLDRNPKGVEPTKYGDALLKRTRIVFDELKQSIKDIEFLADPTTGEIRIASPQGIAFTVIPHIFEWFLKKYPRVVLHFDEVSGPFATRDFQELRDRKYDLILERISPLQAEKPLADDLNWRRPQNLRGRHGRSRFSFDGPCGGRISRTRQRHRCRRRYAQGCRI